MAIARQGFELPIESAKSNPLPRIKARYGVLEDERLARR